MTKPTSLPWQIKRHFDVESLTTIIGNVDGETFPDGSSSNTYDFVARTLDPDDDSQSDDVAIANAAFIVRACNAHADLVEALTDCVARLRACSKFAGNDDWAIDGLCEPFEAALSKALTTNPTGEVA